MRTSAKPNKLYTTRKVLMRAIQKCTFYLISATITNVMGIYVKFVILKDACSPNVAMSRDPRSKFRKKNFFLNSAFNIRKGYKISSRKALYFRSYQLKTSLGGGVEHPSAFRVNWGLEFQLDVD